MGSGCEERAIRWKRGEAVGRKVKVCEKRVQVEKEEGLLHRVERREER